MWKFHTEHFLSQKFFSWPNRTWDIKEKLNLGVRTCYGSSSSAAEGWELWEVLTHTYPDTISQNPTSNILAFPKTSPSSFGHNPSTSLRSHPFYTPVLSNMYSADFFTHCHYPLTILHTFLECPFLAPNSALLYRCLLHLEACFLQSSVSSSTSPLIFNLIFTSNSFHRPFLQAILSPTSSSIL